MDQKLRTLVEKLKDERSMKVVFLSHCMLNANVRYLGGAFKSESNDRLIDYLREKRVGIVQMPCPEQRAWGGILKKRIWYALGSKGSFTYRFRRVYFPLFLLLTRRKYKGIASETASEIQDYTDSGYEVLGIIGISDSPSCGVGTTIDLPGSFDFLARTKLEDIERNSLNEEIKKLQIEGDGIFIKSLRRELDKRKISANFYPHDFREKTSLTLSTYPDNK